MIRVANLLKRRCGPIGLDIGSRSLKLVQLSRDRGSVVEAARWELPAEETLPTPEARRQAVLDGLRHTLDHHQFRGSEAVLCLGSPHLFVQNIRVPKSSDAELQRLVQQEAAARVPYSIGETEIRFLDAADIRQGDTTKREVILLACHRPLLEEMLGMVTSAGLAPLAVDIEPAAMLRAYCHGFRRSEDRDQRMMVVHVGATNTSALIAQGSETLFVKYIDIGGAEMDQAVSRHLDLEPEAAALLRRHNGDRRTDQQDPEVAHGVAQAIRPIVERLANELALCVRYHSVTFRGAPLARLILGGGEAGEALAAVLGTKLDMKCELGDPLRGLCDPLKLGRAGQWDVAAGLALRDIE